MQTEQAIKIAVDRADIAVLWALGDLDGPLAGEVKIGLTTRRAFQAQASAMRAARSRQLAKWVEVYMRGQAPGLRLRAALEHHLTAHGMEIGRPWFRVDHDQLPSIVSLLAASENVRLITEDDAKEIEQREFAKLMDESISRG